MMSPSIWLSAFPKSGSTWLRFLLHHLVHGSFECSQDVDHGMPSLHGDDARGWKPAIERGGIVLTHKTFSAHTDYYPRVEAFIQMVRHPADVALSDAHFFALTQLDKKLASEKSGRSVEVVMNELGHLYLNNILLYGKVPKQDRLGFGTWSENVTSWLAQRTQRPSILVRYEDLKREPIAQLERLCAFLGLNRSRAELEAARDSSSVQAMKAMQEREIREQIPGRFYNPRHKMAYGAGLRFVRKGAVGQELLEDSGVTAKLLEHFGPAMERLGYTLESGQGAAGPLDESLREIRPLRV